MHPTGPGDQTHAWFGKAEASMLGCDDQIARQGYLKASAYSNAVHCCDDRLAALEASGDPTKRYEPVRHLFSPGGCGSRCLEVVTGRKRALSGPRQNGNPALPILLEVIENLSQLNVRLVVQGVHNLWPI